VKSELPTGTVTFLFTDIEGSTKHSQDYAEALSALLARHREILKQTIAAYNGFIFQVVGDSVSAAFDIATNAIRAASEAQRLFNEQAWSPAPIRVRMGIHTGAARLADDPSIEGPYSGYTTLALTQRIMSAAYGGQILYRKVRAIWYPGNCLQRSACSIWVSTASKTCCTRFIYTKSWLLNCPRPSHRSKA